MHPEFSRAAGGGQPADPVATAWAKHAPRLAAHYDKLRNRSDVYGAYRPISERRTDSRTGRIDTAYVAKGLLTIALLIRHFAGLDRGHLVGLHVSSPGETCRWIVVDIDAHDEDADPAANLRMARAVYRAAKSLGLDVLLLESDGGGGYHLWVIFAAPVPMADAWRLAQWLVRGYAEFGLAEAPEAPPKGPRLTGKRIGGFIRLPGLHHTFDYWTRAWDGRRWLTGSRAIGAILAVTGRDVDLSALIPADFEPVERKSTGRRPAPGKRPSPEPAKLKAIGRRPDREGRPAPSPSAREIALARAALGHLGDDVRDDYHTWLVVGMALRQLGEAGLRLWHEWSEPSPKYRPEVLDEKWESFAAGDEAPEAGLITLGTLFHLAKARGWAGPSRRRGPAPKTVTISIRTPKVSNTK